MTKQRHVCSPRRIRASMDPHGVIRAARNPTKIHVSAMELAIAVAHRGCGKTSTSATPSYWCTAKRKEHSHGLKSSRYHRRRSHDLTVRHIERLFRPVPPGAVSFLGSSRCFRCCPELELADGRRVTSRRGSAAVRADDVRLHQTRDSNHSGKRDLPEANEGR